ncbi:ankyrin repeat-containing protein [Anaeramoeba ignava]|uniref:Ankyrin repeat-containing protein n=1 Tax=Anaeramoeba ignava TaxID=1746090 RepID=A0A9Q0LCY1_ANAIG|nr:ankyrin repeat-containing protein [Anaeramoeba ignava]
MEIIDLILKNRFGEIKKKFNKDDPIWKFKTQETLLHLIMCKKPTTKQILFLLEYIQVDVESGITPLHYAIENNVDFEIIRLLIDMNSDIEKRNGETPLFIALRKQNSDAVNYLIKKGARISAIEGNSVLHYACQYQASTSFIKDLVESRLDINQENHQNSTSFHLALSTENPNIETIKFLISKGADLNKSNSMTPLHFLSTFSDDVEVLKLLLDSGALIDKLDKNNPVDIAFQMGHSKILDFFLGNGKKFSRQLEIFLDFFRNKSDPKTLEVLMDNMFIFNLKIDFSNFIFNFETTETIDLLHFIKPRDDYRFLIAKSLFNYGGEVLLTEDDSELQELRDKNLSIIDDFKTLYKNQEFCDLTIHCIDGKINLHKTIFNARVNDFTKAINFLQDQPLKSTKRIVKFLYTGMIKKETDFSNVKNFYEKIDENYKKRIGKKGLISDISKLYEKKDTSNFIIKVLDQEIHVHREILIARCGLFQGMFLAARDDKSNFVNDYSGKSFQAISLFIKFLYFDVLDDIQNLDLIDELNDAHDYYQLNSNSIFYSELEKIKDKTNYYYYIDSKK